ncbi:hypothetical protein, partial [Bacillus cereus]|uniref:hypothetical protein n=1 Tax=Bacillus cereus TaxID=1396 RepID=UPI0019D60802
QPVYIFLNIATKPVESTCDGKGNVSYTIGSGFLCIVIGKSISFYECKYSMFPEKVRGKCPR